MNIEKKLNLWVEKNLMEDSQKQAILKYEANIKNRALLYMFLFLGGFCLCLGIISLIAYNWQIVPSAIKLIACFMILAGLGGAAVVSLLDNRQLLSETLLWVYALLLLGSIGLISQIYQLTAHGAQALLFWTIIIIPLLPFVRRVWLPFFWLPMFAVSLLDVLFDYAWFSQSFEAFERAFPGAWQIALLLFSVSSYRLLADGGDSFLPLSNAFKIWTLFLLTGYVVYADIWGLEIFKDSAEKGGLLGLTVWLSLTCLTGAFCWFNVCRGNRYWSLALFVVLDFALVARLLPKNETLFSIWGAMQSLSLLVLAFIYACRKNRLGLQKWLMSLIALRFFIIYIQVFGNLLYTGVGLFFSGLILLAAVYGWLNRSRLTTFVKRGR